MEMSYPHLIWANKPGCSSVVAEIWLGRSDLWFTIFVDDTDKTLKSLTVTDFGVSRSAAVASHGRGHQEVA
jgi:hypothetical protein